MSTIITAVCKNKDEDIHKLQIIKSCKELGITIPEELRGFRPVAKLDIAYRDGGVLEIENRVIAQEWIHSEHNDIQGVDIVLDALPREVEKIRITFE